MDKRPLERAVEQNCLNFAKALGVTIAYKMNGLGMRSWPDRMFLYKGRVLFIEFKRLGEKPTPKQALMHERLKSEGFHVFVVDNVAQGRGILTAWTVGNGLGGLH